MLRLDICCVLDSLSYGFDDSDKFQAKPVIRSRVDCLLKTQNIRVGIHVNTFRKFVVDDRSNSCRHCNQSQ
ncbi:unnamed protein product [Brugia pahangi]|uniref:Uncharacterized protein n=1 Tax=Brugia pahangi TaxID=6280 RepID=A0A0N4TNF4_BRUPA|nr:unnamed protein product [Brugia pahangi]